LVVTRILLKSISKILYVCRLILRNMGSFEEHVRFGYLAAAIFSITSVLYFPVIPYQSKYKLFVICFTGGLITTFIGAVFPDIDHHASKPYRFVRTSGFILATVISLLFLVRAFRIYQAHIRQIRIEYVILLFVLSLFSIIGIGLIVINIMDYVQPKHRGITHSLSTGVIISTVIVFAGQYIYNVYNITSVTTALLGWGFLLGFISHLYCDGILP